MSDPKTAAFVEAFLAAKLTSATNLEMALLAYPITPVNDARCHVKFFEDLHNAANSFKQMMEERRIDAT